MSLCPKCSANIPEGDLICPVCGTEIQLVPDYETLNLDLIDEENLKAQDNEAAKLREAALLAAQEKIFRRNRLKKIIIVLAVVAALCVTAWFLWNYWQENANKETVLTFDDYYQQALIAYNSKEYDNANGILIEALKLEPGNVDALVLQAKITYDLGNKFDAISALKTIIDNNPDAVEAYRELIEIYLADNDTASINDLLDSSPESIQTALADYISGAPIFSLEAGTYTEEQDVTITSTGTRIYYTTDGSAPGTTSPLYTEAVHLSEGTTILRAVSETAAGIMSSVTEARYIIDRNAPDAPKVSPDSGTYYSDENEITVTIPVGCKCYYSFDSKPTVGKNEYTGPVKMLEGGHIFYAMLVNDQGVAGAVAAATFIYYPEEESTEEYSEYEEETYTEWTPEPTVAPEVTETPTPTETETPEPTETAKPTKKPEKTENPTPEPTKEETPEPTAEPTQEVTPEPTAAPTAEPTLEPTQEPTPEPTEEPTPEPTAEPTPEPTEEPPAETATPDVEPTVTEAANGE